MFHVEHRFCCPQVLRGREGLPYDAPRFPDGPGPSVAGDSHLARPSEGNIHGI